MRSVRTDGRGESARERMGRARSVRRPWAVVCAVVTVVLGPAAVTASALDQAGAAPPHHAAEGGRPRGPGTAGRTGG
ncbi:hypothetical protein ACWDY4_19905 [Streptomyces olivaceoviridis]